jgi:hypothetical protein
MLLCRSSIAASARNRCVRHAEIFGQPVARIDKEPADQIVGDRDFRELGLGRCGPRLGLTR